MIEEVKSISATGWVLIAIAVLRAIKSSWTSARIVTSCLDKYHYSLLGEGISLPGLAFIFCVHPNG